VTQDNRKRALRLANREVRFRNKSATFRSRSIRVFVRNCRRQNDLYAYV